MPDLSVDGFAAARTRKDMTRIRMQFQGSLNDFFQASKKGRPFELEVAGNPAVLDPIQALGVPHTEVGALFVNGLPETLSCRVREADEIVVCPGGRRPERRLSFLLDVHLGKLARHLRLFGFSVLYRNDYSDARIAELASRRDCLVLTRDIGLLKHRRIRYGYWLRSTDPYEQLREIFERFRLYPEARPFRICLECNGRLSPVSKKSVIGELPPRTRLYFDSFRRCGRCRRVFWPGSHYRKMKYRVAQILGHKRQRWTPERPARECR